MAISVWPARPGLLDRVTAFTEALRRAQIPVSTAETVDAVRALGAIDILDRDGLHAAFAATLCKRPAYRITFDGLFDLYFPARRGDGAQIDEASDPDALVTPGSMSLQDLDELGSDLDDDTLRTLLRQMLGQALLDGDAKDLEKLAREAVRRLGRVAAQPGRQTWFAYKVLRTMSAETMMADLVAGLLDGEEKGGLAERVARATAQERIRAFEQAVEAEVRRRVAEERGIGAVEKTAVKQLADQVDFLRASKNELMALRREVQPLARRLATRLTVRRHDGRSGRLDIRRTVRASLAYGGVPLETKWRPPRPRKPDLVVLCDVSGSVASFAHFTLLLTHALREQFTKVRAFAFIDTTDEVTKFFGPQADLADVMDRVRQEADLVWLDGHSDYGHALEVFDERYPDAVGPRTSLLVLGDARTNYRHPGTDALRRLVARSRHTYWLNPEPRSSWSTGDSVTWAYEPLVEEMVECRNAAQLTEFVERILPH
jgi:uncharacterized protein with von Willebrand factor type A (vWA) domain